jgi:hypothetical protein
MSGKAGGGAAGPAPVIVITAREHEEDRKKAKGRHRSHYRVQMFGWGAVIVLAALSYPIQDLFRHLYFASCGAAHALPASCVAVHWGSLVLPPVVLLIVLAWHYNYRFLKQNDWKVAIGNAQQTISPQNVTKGYTDLFNLYMRTKRRSYLLGAWGLLVLVYVIAGTIVNLRGITSPEYWVAQAGLVVLAAFLINLGYKLGSSYLPGDVIVRHMLALSIFAISDVTNVEEARLQAERDAELFVRANPWWFYPG